MKSAKKLIKARKRKSVKVPAAPAKTLPIHVSNPDKVFWPEEGYTNGQTVVAPYSVRRRPQAPFSTPLAWSEVRPALDPSNFNIGNFEKRLQARDP